jgi:hypothetical protein
MAGSQWGLVKKGDKHRHDTALARRAEHKLAPIHTRASQPMMRLYAICHACEYPIEECWVRKRGQGAALVVTMLEGGYRLKG